jgi:hypothetical protein
MKKVDGVSNFIIAAGWHNANLYAANRNITIPVFNFTAGQSSRPWGTWVELLPAIWKKYVDG